VAKTGHDVVLVRHGQTEWSRSGQHTGTTDIPLTEQGRREAEAVGRALRGRSFSLVLSSPMARALETARLAGLGDAAQVREDLMEWDYGDYEGRTSKEIQAERPDWHLFDDGCPGGETAAQVGARADRVIAEARAVDGDVALFAHGHVLRVLTARWLGFQPQQGGRFALLTATLSTLGYEHDRPALWLWNQPLPPR
jgi:broad specificity phosphatase PhoE